MRADIIIVGAGIAGASLAYHLSLAGHKVTLLDRQTPGSEASGGYAGLLTTVADGQAAGPYADLSRAALAATLSIIPELEERSGHTVELQSTPLIRVATNDSSLALLHAYSQKPDFMCPRSRWVEPSELHALSPELSPRLLGAIVAPEVYHLMPSRLVAATIAAAQTLGATLETHTEIVRLLRDKTRITGVIANHGEQWSAAHVIIANGVWSHDLIADLGFELALRPVRGQLAVLDSTHRFDLPFIVTLDRGYIVPKLSGKIVVGATHEDAGFEKCVTLNGMLHLSRVAAVMPRLLGLPVAETFVGLRPMSEDGMPLLGKVPGYQGVSLALGYGQHGVLLANICAALTTQDLDGNDPGPLWSPFQAVRALSPMGQEKKLAKLPHVPLSDNHVLGDAS
jgi:glycine oxidase